MPKRTDIRSILIIGANTINKSCAGSHYAYA